MASSPIKAAQDLPPPPNRLKPSHVEAVEDLADKLGVSVVEVMDAVNVVGTWIPALERKLRPAYGLSAARRWNPSAIAERAVAPEFKPSATPRKSSRGLA